MSTVSHEKIFNFLHNLWILFSSESHYFYVFSQHVTVISIIPSDREEQIWPCILKGFVTLRSYHIETPVLVWSLKLINAKPGQYLSGWLLGNTGYYKRGCAVGVMDSNSEFDITEPSSNFSLIIYIYLRGNNHREIYESTSSTSVTV